MVKTNISNRLGVSFSKVLQAYERCVRERSAADSAGTKMEIEELQKKLHRHKTANKGSVPVVSPLDLPPTLSLVSSSSYTQRPHQPLPGSGRLTVGGGRLIDLCVGGTRF